MAVEPHTLPFIEGRDLLVSAGDHVKGVFLPSPVQRVQTFAHPAEEMLGDLLTFFRIRWIYEPTSFVLKRTLGGAIAKSFTPDFYLPDHCLYLELTTMRQPLVTRKNGKIRRLRELYPTVQIKTLYRRDYERIMQTAGLNAPAATRPGKVVFDSAQILARTQSLAREICTSLDVALLQSGPLVLISSRAEVEPFQRLLALALNEQGIAVALDRLELSRFNGGETERRISLAQAPTSLTEGRAVLLVAGATSTGLSLDYALSHLRRQRPSWLEAVSLLDRPAARLVEAPVRFRGFEAPPDLLTGFGLSAWPDHAAPAILAAAAKEARSVTIDEA